MKIGFIGAGNMGRHMARNVLSGSHEMKVFDISREATRPLEEAGATRAGSPAEAASGAEIVFTSLPMPADVLEVAAGEGGAFSGMSTGAVLVDLSTVDPGTAQRLAEAGRGHGVHVVDSPVSGGTGGAEKGTLCLMVGGDKNVFEHVRPVLELIGQPDRVIHCGEIGSGSVCKLANNMVGLSTNVLLAEAFGMAAQYGVEARTLYEVMSNSSGNSATLTNWSNSILRGDFSPGFMLDLAVKDIGLATELGRSQGLPMEAANTAQQRFLEAKRRGWGRDATPVLGRLQEERVGKEFRFRDEEDGTG
ncbi:MAG: NAD(P)-dependent oxidoreductase [Chloroflexota bacterium]